MDTKPARRSTYTPIVAGARIERRAVCLHCFENDYDWWCQPESEIGDRCLADCETETGRPRKMVGRLFYVCLVCEASHPFEPRFWATPANGGSAGALRAHIAAACDAVATHDQPR